jgi:phosphatidylinositol-3-phosphatase
MENEGVCDIVPSVACGSAAIGPAPYMTSLAAANGLAENYTAITHPSLPNYLSLLSGRDWGCSGFDVGPNSNPCTSSAWNSTSPTLVDRLEASGLTWKAYMENMPSNCDTVDSGLYAVRHDPFVYFKSIVNDTARCNKIVPAGTNDTVLLNDLASTSTASNFMWLTPNLCNDMHDDCTTNPTSPVDCQGNITNCIRQGDTYLSYLVPEILSSNIFTTQRAALFVTMDEGNGYCPVGAPSRDCIYTVWAGSVIKKNSISTTSYSHFSFLATLETAWDLQPLTANDSAATPMSEFFTTLFPIQVNASPSSPETGQQVDFSAVTSGGTGPYSFNWNFGDATVATGRLADHVFSSSGSFLVTVNATDSEGATVIASQTINVGLRPTYTIVSCPTTGTINIPLSCSATVVDTGSGSASNPLGTVNFTPSGTCTLASGSCSALIRLSTTGVSSVTARYVPSDSAHATSSASIGIFITRTPLGVSNHPANEFCILSLCSSADAWTLATVGAVILIAVSAVIVSRKRPTRRAA